MGMVRVAAIIIVDGGFGHTCLGPHADNFAQPYLTTMMIPMGLVVVEYL